MHDTEFENVKKYLRMLVEKGPPYPEPIFLLLNRLAPMISIEAIIVNEYGQVFLTRRPIVDLHHPNMWHFPGTLLLSAEIPEDGIQRIWEEEMKETVCETNRTVTIFTPYGEDSEEKNSRGGLEQRLYLFRTKKCIPSERGEFFDIHSLPEPIIGFHKKILKKLSVEWEDIFRP